MLIDCLTSVESRHQERERERERPKDMDPDTHFAMDIAESLRKLSPRENAIAKIKLLGKLTSIEFLPEQYAHTSNYSAQNYFQIIFDYAMKSLYAIDNNIIISNVVFAECKRIAMVIHLLY